MSLTKLQVEKALPSKDGKLVKLTDGLGLSLHITPKGGKYWRMRYRWAGKEQLLSLGTYPETSLKDAREKRDEIRRQLANGIDPSEQRKEEKQAREMAEKNNFEAVAREWHRIKAAEWAPRHALAVLTTLETYLFPALGKRPVNDIEPQELLEVLRKVERSGKLDTAKRLRERCNAIFRLAIVSGLAKFNPAADLFEALKPPKSKPRPALSKEQLPAFLLALETTDTITKQTRLLFQVIMTCFTRVGETVKAEWKHIDFENGLWTIPPENRKLKHKLRGMANPHIVPMPRQVVEAFKELELYRTRHCPYIFPGFRNPRSHMNEATLLKALERMGYGGNNKENGHVVTHGFRATASTILNEAGFNPDAVERQLSHVEKNMVRAAYNRAQYLEERREMLQCWADHLDSLKTEGKVVPLRAGKNSV